MKKKYEIDKEDLREIRNNADWKRIWEAFQIAKDEKRSKENEWWGLSPFTTENTASFHMSESGFHCFSSGESGGKIELTQKLLGQQLGKIVNCYEAGKWLIENGLSGLVETPESQNLQLDLQLQEKGQEMARSEEKRKQGNLPIRQNLLPLLSEQGEHAEFVKRGISKATCEYLGCGFLAMGKLKNPDHALNERIVFQVRGLSQSLKPVILSHIGRATTEEQKIKNGKWWGYGGFSKSFEIYNVDKLLLDEKALSQTKQNGTVLIVEGCFDIAKVIEAGIYNVVATFGADLAKNQLSRIHLIAQTAGIQKFIVWYDRDINHKGEIGQNKAIELLKSQNYEAVGFNWMQIFGGSGKTIPANIKDPCDFSIQQLQYLRKENLI